MEPDVRVSDTDADVARGSVCKILAWTRLTKARRSHYRPFLIWLWTRMGVLGVVSDKSADSATNRLRPGASGSDDILEMS